VGLARRDAWADAVIHVHGQDTAVRVATAETRWHGSFTTATGLTVEGPPTPFITFE
jgi:hypothetical protein